MLTQQAPPTKTPPAPKTTRALQRDQQVLARLDAAVAQRPAHAPPTFSRDEVAALFGVGPRTVTRWASFLIGSLPRHYPDGVNRLPRQTALHRYHPDAIRAWVQDGLAPHAGRKATG